MKNRVNDWFSFSVYRWGMDTTGIKLFDLAEKRLAWADQRQALLAANIANAGTPSFQPADLHPFNRTLSRVGGGVQPARTDPAHRGRAGEAEIAFPRQVGGKTKGPDKNGVTMDEQLTKVADTQSIQALVTSIHKKYTAMFAMALGKGQS